MINDLYKYYSYYQFFYTILTIFFTLVTIVGILLVYNKDKDFKKKYIVTMFLLLIGVSVGRFLENIVPYNTFSLLLRNITYILLIVCVFVFYFYILNLYISFKHSLIFTTMLLALLLGIYAFDRDFLVVEYTYRTIRFSGTFKYIVLIVLVINVFVLLFINLREDPVIMGFSNHLISYVISFLYFLPMVVYGYLVIADFEYIAIYEMVMLILFSFILTIYIYYMTPFGISVLTFDKIGDITPYYIFVLDRNKKIIYRNRIARFSKHFAYTKKGNNIEDVFAREAKFVYGNYGKDFLMVKEENKDYYFDHNIKEIKDGDVLIGYIITIVDITEIIEILSSLEVKQEQIKLLTDKLHNKYNFVRRNRKEKEVNKLLDKIVFTKKGELEKLSSMLKDLELNVGEEDFEQMLDETISCNRKILSDIRSIVNDFNKDILGGDND